MTINFDNQRPIYIQLLEHFQAEIITGSWSPGQKITSVRELALTYEVNPNTVQRALSELERLNLAQSDRTRGRFVTEDLEVIKELRRDSARQMTEDYIRSAKSLQLDQDDALSLVKKYWDEEEGGNTL
ncbi:MAG: GntR family transcriptional regulator [Eubacteriales bacterium]|nr:GntR family transcriptional regulator [Eubacteriales bacterium]MDD4324119.1 GntR family transcriptional regulator [Eubacteriales bacterium]MDD4541454.1 GntR family transcriptional regulator [Eubacteriales bacterium]